MKTHLLLSAVSAMLYLHADAANSLKVLLKSKESFTFALNEKPLYWTTANSLNIKTSSLFQEFDLDDVEKISFGDNASSVESFYSDGGTSVFPSLATENVFISTPAASNVEIINNAGAVVAKFQTSDSDEVKLNINDWQTGVYIVNVNEKSFKIIKK